MAVTRRNTTATAEQAAILDALARARESAGGSSVQTVKLIDREFVRDPHPRLRALREATPSAVPLDRLGLVMWLVTRYDDVRRILGDRGFKKDVPKYSELLIERSGTPREQVTRTSHEIMRGVLTQDDDDHRRLRALVKDHFRPGHADELRSSIERRADDLLEELATDEPVDLVARFTSPLAAGVTSDMLDIPVEDRDQFPDWWNTLLTGMTKDEIEDASRKLGALCRRLWQSAESGRGLIGHLVQAERDNELDEADEGYELTSLVANFLIGGMEPSTAIASGIALLLDHPAQLSRLLADPGLMASAVEEIVRYESPFKVMSPRFSADDLHLDGLTIPAGELIILCLASANRDPRAFAEPETFDISRRPNPHLAWGYGPHYCLGVHLARLEISIALGRFFARFPRSRLAVPWGELKWRPGTWMRRLESLPVVVR